MGWRYLLKSRYKHSYSNQVWHSVTPIKSEPYTLATCGLFIAFSIGGFISSAFDKFKGEDIDLSKFKIEINKEDSNTENDRVLIIRDKDTLINIQD